VRVGIDDFAQKLVGTPDGFDLPSVGSTVRQGMRGWGLQVDDRQIDMLSPIDGEVVGINQAALDSPAIVSEDPYDRGWLLEVRAPDRATFTNLLTGSLAHAWMEQTAERVKTMQPDGLGVLMADGGAPIAGFARALRPDDWDELARDFFLTK
jgi:glycine cleavage system H lipoate-binding protein